MIPEGRRRSKLLTPILHTEWRLGSQRLCLLKGSGARSKQHSPQAKSNGTADGRSPSQRPRVAAGALERVALARSTRLGTLILRGPAVYGLLPPLAYLESGRMAPQPAAIQDHPTVWIRRGSSAYRRISGALFLAGFATFSLLYCVQPLLPTFADEFHVGPAGSSLALSLTTGSLAFAILCAAPISAAVGRRGVMFGSMFAAAGCNIAAALAPGWPWLLAIRALEGLALGGVPAVAMAYLAEEIDPRDLGLAMGLLVGGNAFGGMIGRVGVGALAELTSWRLALGVLGLICLVVALGFLALAPRSRNFSPRRGPNPGTHLGAWGDQLRQRGLLLLFAIGFLAMGALVTVYNYIGFRLMAAPYALSEGQVGLIFATYLFGIAASPVAGAAADRLGRGFVLLAGILLGAVGLTATLSHSLVGIVAGIAVFTIGFFVTHSVASGWVGVIASAAKGHAASLYLLAYYLGSSLMGSLGGWFWSREGWSAVVAFTAGLLALALVAALRLFLGARCTKA